MAVDQHTQPISFREKIVATSAGLTLASTAWLLGGVYVWALSVYLLGSVTCLLAAILPLPADWNGVDGQDAHKVNCRRLIRLPAFWCFAAFLIYICIQGFNPAYTTIVYHAGEYIEPIDSVDWLPSGVRSDYHSMNAFRMLTVFGTAFSLVCGIWVGLRRRECVIAVFWAFAVSGTLMALYAIILKFIGAEGALGFHRVKQSLNWGSFIYRNQGAAYLNLVSLACAVLFFVHFGRSVRRAKLVGPHLLLLLCYVLVLMSVFLALSRGGILFGSALVVFFLLLLFLRLLTFRALGLSFVGGCVVIFICVVSSAFFLRYVDFEAIDNRFGDVEETIRNIRQDSRYIVSERTWQMASDNLKFGWGAGSWRYIFPDYQKHVPELYFKRYNRHSGSWLGRRYYQYAHNDILQFLSEYGIVGCSFLVLALVNWLWAMLRFAGSNWWSVLIVSWGALLTLGHAFLDFIFNSPSVLLGFCGVLVLSAKLLQVEWLRRHSRRSKSFVS